jgi:hypothetical protein
MSNTLSLLPPTLSDITARRVMHHLPCPQTPRDQRAAGDRRVLGRVGVSTAVFWEKT